MFMSSMLSQGTLVKQMLATTPSRHQSNNWKQIRNYRIMFMSSMLSQGTLVKQILATTPSRHQSNKWKQMRNYRIMFIWRMLSQGTVMKQMLATTPFTPSKYQLKTNKKICGNDSFHAVKVTTENKWETIEYCSCDICSADERWWSEFWQRPPARHQSNNWKQMRNYRILFMWSMLSQGTVVNVHVNDTRHAIK